MCDDHRDALWRGFPKSLTEFEERFPDEEACRAYWIDLRWSGRPACAGCNGHSVWRLERRGHFECADCGQQTSLTSGTLLHGTRKPLKLWFRVVFEMSVRRNGISAKDVQRIMGFGSCRSKHISSSMKASSVEKKARNQWFSSAPKSPDGCAWRTRRTTTGKPWRPLSSARSQ